MGVVSLLLALRFFFLEKEKKEVVVGWPREEGRV
jgi:hypothetical protein